MVITGVASWLAEVILDRFFFISKVPLFNVLAAHFFKKDIDEYFRKVSFFETEAGLEKKINDEIVSVFFSTFEFKAANKKIFSSMIDYVDFFSQTHDLTLNYFRDIFELYMKLNLLIIGCFVFVQSLKKCSNTFAIVSLKFLNKVQIVIFQK